MKSLFAILFVSLFSVAAQAQSFSSASCYAYTQCYATDAWGRSVPNGTIACQTYGAAYTGNWGGNTAQCSWFTQPYTSVSCNGFVKSFDVYGNVIWGWQNFHFRCPGR